MPGWQLASEIARGNIDPADYIEQLCERIRRLNPLINAYITVKPCEQLKHEATTAKGKGKLAPLLVAVKDNIHVKGLPVTCASKMLEKYIAPYNATVVERLLSEGAIVAGKTNMDEFAMGSTGETSAFGPTRNPWNPNLVPGGSSSGTAAALAAGMATLGLGSDTGGSIRIPAAWTGLYGLKPTYGLVSRYGLVAYADSLEQIGPMTRNAMDLAILLETMAGFDPHDSTSLRVRKLPLTSYVEQGYTEGIKGVKVATIADFLEHEGVDEKIKDIIVKAEEKLEEAGAKTRRVKLGRDVIDYSLPAYYTIAMAEASSNLARYDGIRYGPKEPPEPWESWNKYYSRIRGKYFGREVKLRIMLGSWFLSAGYRDQYYIRALKIRRLVKKRLQQTLTEAQILLLPAVVSLPPRIGEVINDPQKMYALDLATVPINLAGLPAAVAPIDFIQGIPIGVQLAANHLGEPHLLQALAALEKATGLSNLVAEQA